MQLGVLCHGCHVGAAEHTKIVWGYGSRMGRVPAAVDVLWRTGGDSIIVFGTGASRASDGRVESRVIFDHLVVGQKHLSVFDRLKTLGGVAVVQTPFEINIIGPGFRAMVVLDDVTQTTAQETDHAFSLFRDNGVTDIVVVSSPDHVLRCHVEAMKWLAANPGFTPSLAAVGSQTNFFRPDGSGEYPVGTSVIFEPGHRPDRENVPWCEFLPGLFQVQGQRAKDLADEIASLITSAQD